MTALGLFAVGIFAVGIFAVLSFRRTEFSPYGFFAVGIFAVRIFRRMEFSPQGFFAVRNVRRTEFLPYTCLASTSLVNVFSIRNRAMRLLLSFTQFLVYPVATIIFLLPRSEVSNKIWCNFGIRPEYRVLQKLSKRIGPG